ncbi:MAG: nucleotidyl transferase AbiEii/AbiGii toxin family protein, partial [Verrucomicrobiae bacterium]|nr:nucleotidyl transferase AbiEii/AbiGii toxin family protein [Verrucomicrobiae bacterium]
EDLQDHPQDFLVNEAAKVSFFVPLPELLRVVETNPGTPVRVATLEELFRTKCLVTARRSKTRDWLDMYLLLRNHGFTLLDYREAFVRAGVGDQYEAGLQRMCLGQPQHNDEGYEHLLSCPPTLNQMREFFQEQRDWLERKLAAS